MKERVSPTLEEAETAWEVCHNYVKGASNLDDLWGFQARVILLSDNLNYRLLADFPRDVNPVANFEWMSRHMLYAPASVTSLPYSEFLATPYWAIVRDYILETRGRECAICKGSDHLNVHHRTYEHHGMEHRYLDELILLCKNCHSKFHDKLPERLDG